MRSISVSLATIAFLGVSVSTTEALPLSKGIPTMTPPSSRPVIRRTITFPQPTTVTFKCVRAGSGYTTMVSNGVRRATLITWNSTSFGPNFSPQTRCNIVSQKFQTAVNNNGGRLSNLVLTIGLIKNQTVVCAVKQAKYGCNSDNMLFTLNSENARNPGAVLSNLLQIGKYGSGNTVNETTELPEFNLEDLVNQKLLNSPQTTLPQQPSTPSRDTPDLTAPNNSDNFIF